MDLKANLIQRKRLKSAVIGSSALSSLPL